MKNDDPGKCPLCGKPCRWEIVQIHAGTDGFVHLDCLQETAESLVETEREIERRA